MPACDHTEPTKPALAFLRSRWLLLACFLYALALGALWHRPEFSPGESLMELFIFGFGFSLIAWWSTMRAKPLAEAAPPTRSEMIALGIYVASLSAYLAFGPQAIDAALPESWITSERIHFFIALARKLVVFVFIPFLLFGLLRGRGLRDFGAGKSAFRELFHSHLPVVLALSCTLLLFQYFMGGGAAPLREGKFTSHQLALGLPLCFLWLMIEAGLVEEFFFRALVQSRLSAWLRSETGGIVLMALIFGLAHAPGFIFRHAGTVEGLGANPAARDAIAYSIVTLSVSGLFFGIAWARTRNLYALMIIHAATDLLPNLADFVRIWNL